MNSAAAIDYGFVLGMAAGRDGQSSGIVRSFSEGDPEGQPGRAVAADRGSHGPNDAQFFSASGGRWHMRLICSG